MKLDKFLQKYYHYHDSDEYLFNGWFNWKEENKLEGIISVSSLSDIPISYDISRDKKSLECLFASGDRDLVPLTYFNYEFPVLRYVFCINSYDGPIEGLCTKDDEYYWFNTVKFEEDWKDMDVGPRMHALYKLKKSELKRIQKMREKFRNEVGKHCDYGDMYAPFNPSHKNEYQYYKETKKERKKAYGQITKRNPDFIYPEDFFIALRG